MTGDRSINTIRRPWNAYFTIVSAVLLVLSVVAFSDNLFTDIHQPSNSDPKFIIHGLFGLAWYVLLTLQANLVRVGNLRRHRAIGTAGFIVALGVVITTLYIFVVVWKGWSAMPPHVRSNRLFLPGFAVCMWLAWRRRNDPAWHKRLILAGTFFMQQPVLDRAFDPLVPSWAKPLFSTLYTERFDEIAFQIYLWGTWIGAFISLAIYDLKTIRKPHIVTISGLLYFGIVWAIVKLT